MPVGATAAPVPDPMTRAASGVGEAEDDACSSGVGEAEGEGGLEVVAAIGAERDVGLGVGHPEDLVEAAGYDIGKFLMGAHPHHGDQVELTRHRIHLADL